MGIHYIWLSGSWIGGCLHILCIDARRFWLGVFPFWRLLEWPFLSHFLRLSIHRPDPGLSFFLVWLWQHGVPHTENRVQALNCVY